MPIVGCLKYKKNMNSAYLQKLHQVTKMSILYMQYTCAHAGILKLRQNLAATVAEFYWW